MKAFLLAAGLGTRLGVLTRDTPKCLLPIAGKPLLQHWFDTLACAGVTDVLLNLHHHADKVRNYVAHSGTTLNVELFYESQLLGSAGTIRDAWEFVGDSESFFIVYADNFAKVDIRRLAQFHQAQGQPILTVLAYPTDEPQRCGILELDDTQRVVSFEEKPLKPRSNFANAGIHIAGCRLREFLPDRTPADLGFHVLPRLVGRMYGYITDEYIQDIGTPEAYAKACRFAETNG